MRSVFQHAIGLLAIASAASLAGCEDGGVAVSPGGGQVAVARSGSLWVADVDRAEWRGVPAEGTVVGSPAWSPDGNRVVFAVAPAGDASGAADADQSARSPNASDGGAQHTAAIVYDAISGLSTVVHEDVRPPFAWTTSGSRFVGVTGPDAEPSIAVCSSQGGMDARIGFPSGVRAISTVVPLPTEADFAFIGVHGSDDDPKADLYVAQGRACRQVSGTGTVAGIAAPGTLGRLLWLDAEEDAHVAGVLLALKTWDPTTARTARVPLPAALSSIRSIGGFTPAVRSAVFAPAGNRLAVVVDFERDTGGDGGEAHRFTSCYSMETSGTGVVLVRRGDVDADIQMWPSWSRSGGRLAILEDAGDEPRLLIYNSDGTGKRLVPPPSVAQSNPRRPQRRCIRAAVLGPSAAVAAEVLRTLPRDRHHARLRCDDRRGRTAGAVRRI